MPLAVDNSSSFVDFVDAVFVDSGVANDVVVVDGVADDSADEFVDDDDAVFKVVGCAVRVDVLVVVVVVVVVLKQLLSCMC